MNETKEPEKTRLVVSDDKKIKCPNCGEELPEDTVSQLMKKEEKEFGFLMIGVVLGAVLGLVGNLWVAFLFEAIRSLIPEAQWLLSSVLGLVITTLVSIYVLVKMFRFAIKAMGVEAKRESHNESVEP
jgi:hypothetical protein